MAEVEGHLRALLRDVLCGYLDSDLKGVADDILLETTPEPFAPDEERASGGGGARHAPRPRPSRSRSRDPEAPTAVAPSRDRPSSSRCGPRGRRRRPWPARSQHQLDGVTESADWGWDDPGDFSAPV